MIRLLMLLTCVSYTAVAMAAETEKQTLQTWLDQHLGELVQTYQTLHRNPELSLQESETAALIAGRWRQFGFEVTTGVGGHGVVGVLPNGDGPTLMLRCDLDALPVTEQTQLPYASTKTAPIAGGGQTGVMHACGHDIHMTNLIGTSQYLAEHRDRWSGTLMVIAQPAEELGQGAKAMLDDGLFERFAKPDFAVAMHVSSDDVVGTVGLMPGYSQANVDSVDITVRGRAGHGSAPEKTIDPIVQAAELVMALQTIVSREVDPQQPAVVTVGSIHGGTKHNIISDRCHLQLTVRTYDDGVRQQVLAAIRRKAKAVADAHDAPQPEVMISEGTPSLNNDAELAGQLKQSFARAIGAANVFDSEPSMGGEDFSRYGRQGVPIVLARLGSVAASRLARFEALGVPPPSLHSGLYYPDPEATLRTGIAALATAAIDLLEKAERRE